MVDGYGHTAVRDKDYTVLFLDENGTQVDTLSEPGKYTIVLEFFYQRPLYRQAGGERCQPAAV